jgi:hypothetical protein
MYDIEMDKPSEAFARCWQAAGIHLSASTQDGSLSWLKATLTPPFLEHLSFRMGNQLFFVRLEDADGNVHGPGNPNGFRTIAKGCNGVPCRMPMRQTGSEWEPELPGWGLIHADTGQPLDPVKLISDEKIEMTDWEIHDFAVQVVRDYIVEKLGRQLMSSQGNPELDPSIWFAGEDDPEWVVVRAVKYPEKEAPLPENIADIAADCARLSTIGHFASVSVANSEDSFDPSGKVSPHPLWRGHGMVVRFEGLIPATVQ